jgi:hypothetical protein
VHNLPGRSSVRRASKNIRYWVRHRAATHPSYLVFARHGRHRDEAVHPHTDVVVEGFPRSGNTFAALALQIAQPSPLTIAHHLHAPANVLGAVRDRIPALLLIREPDDTVLSEVQREQPVSMSTVLAAYCRFYESLMPHTTDVVVGEFGEVTTDFGGVVRALNDRFGTSFRPFEHTPENVARVFGLIEEREVDPGDRVFDRYLSGRITIDDVMTRLERRGTDRANVPESSVSRPSERRVAVRSALQAELREPRLASLRRRAYDVYERLVGLAGVGGRTAA